jgi:Xaa-Pro dipeptidase
MVYQHRLQHLQQQLKNDQLLCVTRPTHLKYLFNFDQLNLYEREVFAYISKNKGWLFLSAFTDVQQQKNVDCRPLTRQLTTDILKIGSEHHITTLLIDSSYLTAAEYLQLSPLQHASPPLQVQPFPSDLIMKMRTTKDTAELQLLAQANQITAQCLQEMFEELAVGMTEKDVRTQLHHKFRAAGMEELAFPTIVAFAEHSELPHHQPTEKKLTENMTVLIDCGGKVDGYCADITRTIWFGEKPSALYLKIQSTVMQAHAAAFKRLQRKKPITAAELDETARAIIETAGFGDQFIHTLGHGVGLDIHEPPSLNNHNPQVITDGMCITVEPGIYLEGKFGFRHEDSVMLTDTGYQLLSDPASQS